MALFGKKTKNKKEEVKNIDQVEVGHEQSQSPLTSEGVDAWAYRWIHHPHVTEKGTNLAHLNKYIFKISTSANKIEIKKAIEKLYNVHVNRVNIQTMPAKKRQVGKHTGYKKGFKKAIITLKDGDSIEVAQRRV